MNSYLPEHEKYHELLKVCELICSIIRNILVDKKNHIKLKTWINAADQLVKVDEVLHMVELEPVSGLRSRTKTLQTDVYVLLAEVMVRVNAV